VTRVLLSETQSLPPRMNAGRENEQRDLHGGGRCGNAKGIQAPPNPGMHLPGRQRHRRFI